MEYVDWTESLNCYPDIPAGDYDIPMKLRGQIATLKFNDRIYSFEIPSWKSLDKGEYEHVITHFSIDESGYMYFFPQDLRKYGFMSH